MSGANTCYCCYPTLRAGSMYNLAHLGKRTPPLGEGGSVTGVWIQPHRLLASAPL